VALNAPSLASGFRQSLPAGTTAFFST
jgi:hypothetical protein